MIFNDKGTMACMNDGLIARVLFCMCLCLALALSFETICAIAIDNRQSYGIIGIILILYNGTG